MRLNHTPATRFLLIAAAALGLTTVTLAIDYQIKYVPDFDQKRGVGPGIPGLPNNGGCYCMPTSAINWIAFLANRGYPELGPPGNWQNPDRYNSITAALDDLGADMFTSPGGPNPNPPPPTLGCGTGGDEAEAALIDGFDALTPGKFVINMKYSENNYAPTYQTLVNMMLTGGLVLLRYGHYEEVFIPATGLPAYARDGGHIVSLTGVTNYLLPGTTLRYRNPSSEQDPDTLTEQSLFSTDTSTVQNVTTVFDADERTQTRLTSISSPKFIDGFIQIKPTFGLSVCCGSLQLNAMNPVPPIHGNPPQNATFASPSGTPIIDIEIDPELNQYYVITAGSPTSGPPRIFITLPMSGPIMDLTSPTSMTSGRRGELYVLDGAMLRVIDPHAAVPQIDAVSIAGAPIAGRIAYDDRTDEVLGISPTSHELVKIKWSPTAPTTIRIVLPSGLVLSGPPLVTPSQKFAGRYYITSATHSAIYVVEPNTAGALQVVDQINLAPTVGEITNDAMHVESREHVLLARGGFIETFGHNGTGWGLPNDCSYHALPVGNHMRIAASRNNFNPLTMSGPEQLDVIPDQFGPMMRDCDADIAPSPLGNGTVGVPDLLMVINGWGPCPGPTAEMCPGDVAPVGTGDSTVGVPDLLRVINNWGPCP